MKDVKIGDLVRIINEWTAHNPWMKSVLVKPKIALVIKANAFPKDKTVQRWAVILTEGEYQTIKTNRLEAICR